MTGPHSHELSMLLRTLTLLFSLPTPAAAAERPVPVDLELAFLDDASGSIDAEGTELQRRGYADALKHPRILNAITSGYLGRIAVAFIEFAADGCTRPSVEWTEINGKEAAETFGNKIIALPYSHRPGGNAVADAILYSAKSIAQTASRVSAGSSTSRATAPTHLAAPSAR